MREAVKEKGSGDWDFTYKECTMVALRAEKGDAEENTHKAAK